MGSLSKRVDEVRIGPSKLPGLLGLVDEPKGIVLFAHGSGSGRFSPRNNFVASGLREAGLATLLLDLLQPEEEDNRSKVFDIELLASRLQEASLWSRQHAPTAQLPIGYFGASTGAAAALVAAARLGTEIAAIVSRGGRPDLAGAMLEQVQAPTLLIVGSLDAAVLDLNRQALEHIPAHKQLSIVPGATHLFEEPGTLNQVLTLAANWFIQHLPGKYSGR
nr:alpha/beta hydrolase [Noviherbaspirillum massiliense]